MTTAEKLTLEQFLAMPETEPASEYVCGEVVQKPMPDLPHSTLQSYLWLLIYQYLEATRLGIVKVELRCVFGPQGDESAFVPDLVFISKARLPRGDQRAFRPMEVAPDLAIEVLSPGQHAGDFAEKINFYLLNGVRLVWVLDPDRERVHVLAPGRNPILLTVEDVLDGDIVLPGFLASVEDIFKQIRAVAEWDVDS